MAVTPIFVQEQFLKFHLFYPFHTLFIPNEIPKAVFWLAKDGL